MGAAALTIDQNQNCVTDSKQCLDKFNQNPGEFLLCCVTVDEIWIHHYSPEAKGQSAQWVSSREPAPKKAKTIVSSAKVLTTIFLDSQAIILINYLQKRRSISERNVAPFTFRHIWPCDFFPNMNKWLSGKRFATNE